MPPKGSRQEQWSEIKKGFNFMLEACDVCRHVGGHKKKLNKNRFFKPASAACAIKNRAFQKLTEKKSPSHHIMLGTRAIELPIKLNPLSRDSSFRPRTLYIYTINRGVCVRKLVFWGSFLTRGATSPPETDFCEKKKRERAAQPDGLLLATRVYR